MLFSKENARKLLRGDFIPGDGRVKDTKNLKWRKTEDFEVHQCCIVVGHDIQSGPGYCGGIADWIAETKPGMYMSVCNRHKKLI